ncbi:glycosyltransferase [Natrinema sp. 1APR25-10V2]|uniref:glycosyltransferase n=1 Tax=Natrinema sp. 1APR25-10V2 TaxID=2951081 RepID=UPI002874117A|nr:glycosyltransferase [Natrinema sp. 1APR25-10V2]MDS0475734.1 glycosyltransferase [Natrinema sp. 1APR25-10V2]
MSDRSIAIAHGNYLERGGAESLSDELARTFDAPLYFGFGDTEHVSDDVDARSLYESSLFSGIKRSVFLRDLYYAWNAQQIPELTEYDVVILSKNELSWYVPEDEQVVIHYTHSTPRVPYDLFQQRANSLSSRLYAFVARTMFLPNTKFPDRFVANSELVARRLQRYWGVPEEKVEVVYPPVNVEQYEPRETEDYYLTYSRLIPEKRIDMIVRAFDGLDARLVVGGAGDQRKKLERLAPDNVEFVGYMSESEKRRRLGEAKAVLFNAMNEDFGIIPVEAFASGTPVLGVEEGYTKYQILDGENGLLHDPDPTNIRASVERFEREGVDWSTDEIATFAERFSADQFRTRMRAIVEEAVAEAEIAPHEETDTQKTALASNRGVTQR